MVWCCQAPSHYLSQCWPRSVSSYSISRPQWVYLALWHKNIWGLWFQSNVHWSFYLCCHFWQSRAILLACVSLEIPGQLCQVIYLNPYLLQGKWHNSIEFDFPHYNLTISSNFIFMSINFINMFDYGALIMINGHIIFPTFPNVWTYHVIVYPISGVSVSTPSLPIP